MSAFRISRLYRPRDPRFWLLVGLNSLSAAISYILRLGNLPTAITAILAVFTLGNFAISTYLAVQLMREKPNGAKTQGL